jgi:hypothetical protein
VTRLSAVSYSANEFNGCSATRGGGPLKELLRSIYNWTRLGEHADVYLTAVVAIVVVVFDFFGIISETKISGVVLAVLALISINLLVTRVKVGEFSDRHRVEYPPVILDAFPPSYQQDWRRNGDLLIYGTSLLPMILTYQQWLAERLAGGRGVRVLLMRPGAEAAILASERCYLRTNHHDDAALATVLGLLNRLTSETRGKLEIRFTNQEPTFEATYFEPASAHSMIYVMYYRYRMNSDDQLRLVLRPRDGRLFNLHREQVENLWRDAVSISGHSEPAKTAGS